MEIWVVEAWDQVVQFYRGRSTMCDFRNGREVVEIDRWGGGIDSGHVLGGRAGYIYWGAVEPVFVFGLLKIRIVMERDG